MLIDKFVYTGRIFLGCKYPILCGAMTWISDYKLVGDIANLGGFGFLAGANKPAAVLEKEIIDTFEYTQKPFGVNLITIAPAYKEQLKVVCDLKCKFVQFAGSIPREGEIHMVQDAGTKVICFAPTAPLAFRLIKMGTDALMLEGAEAGGHIGPISLSVLLQQILFQVDEIPIFVAGGIATGRMMAHLLMMGAAGIQMGTRFVMSDECRAHRKFKEAFRKAKAKDAVATPKFDGRLPVIPVRALKNRGTDRFNKLQLDLLKKLEDGSIDLKQAQYEVEIFWVGALREAAENGNIETGSLMSGQSVGLVDSILPLKQIIEQFVNDAESELKRLRFELDSSIPD